MGASELRARKSIVEVVGDTFRALVAFAFARELRFLAAYPDPPARTAQRLRAEIRAVVE